MYHCLKKVVNILCFREYVQVTHEDIRHLQASDNATSTAQVTNVFFTFFLCFNGWRVQNQPRFFGSCSNCSRAKSKCNRAACIGRNSRKILIKDRQWATGHCPGNRGSCAWETLCNEVSGDGQSKTITLSR